MTAWMAKMKGPGLPRVFATIAPDPHEYCPKRKFAAPPETPDLASLHFGATFILHFRPLRALFSASQLSRFS
jgi:hypothetical protein